MRRSRSSISAMFASGVTRFFPTVITGSPENMTARAAQSRQRQRDPFARAAPAMEAFHLEGPYISPEDGPRGAHPARWVRPPDLDEFQRFQEAARGNIRLVTLSPEWPEAPRFIEKIVREGRCRQHRPHPSLGRSDRGCGERRRNAIHASRQRRRCRAAAPSQLPVGATGRGSAGGQLHRRWISSPGVVPERGAARQGTGALPPDHGRRHAGGLRSRAAIGWERWTSICTPMAACGWLVEHVWRARRFEWIAPSRTSCGPRDSTCAKPSPWPPEILRAWAASLHASADSIPAIARTWSAFAGRSERANHRSRNVSQWPEGVRCG